MSSSVSHEPAPCDAERTVSTSAAECELLEEIAASTFAPAKGVASERMSAWVARLETVASRFAVTSGSIAPVSTRIAGMSTSWRATVVPEIAPRT